MILLTFLSFFFVKDQITSFQLKQTVVFLKSSVCVFNMISAYFIFFLINYNRSLTDWSRVPHTVDTLNIKHELRSKGVKQFGIM